MLRRILVPLDGTDYSWRALEYACELAHYTRGTLVIMRVATGIIKQPVIEFETDCLYARIGDEVLDAAYAFMQGKNIDCTYLLENNSEVAESILRTVDEQKCDAVVLGSRGMGALEGLLRSSVSQAVIEKASVPVTIVK